MRLASGSEALLNPGEPIVHNPESLLHVLAQASGTGGPAAHGRFQRVQSPVQAHQATLERRHLLLQQLELATYAGV
jgi:hypothetical protein